MTAALRSLPVDLEELSIAFEAEGTDLQWYVDTDSGAVILINREYDPAEHNGLTATEIETDPNRFLRVPEVDPQHAVDDMRSFADSVTDETLKESLELALSAAGRPEKRFKTALSWLPEQNARWHAWRMERCRQRVTDWLASRGFVPGSRAA
jgi:hypothetical protein